MKNAILPVVIGLAAATLLSGCLNLQLGGGTTNKPQSATVGQQLIDLQRAKDTGVISEAEYNTQKAKILNSQ